VFSSYSLVDNETFRKHTSKAVNDLESKEAEVIIELVGIRNRRITHIVISGTESVLEVAKVCYFR